MRNDGVSDVVGASLSEFLPSSLTGVTYYEVKDNDGETVLEEISGFSELQIDLTANSDVTYQVQGIVAAEATGELEYGVSIAVPEDVTDPDSSNNFAYDQGDGVDEDGNEIDGDRLISGGVDLAVKKTFDLNTVEAIDNNGDGTADQFIASPSDQFTNSFVEYTLTVTNNGEAMAKNVLLFEDLTQKNPIGLEFDQFINLDGGTALDTDENANTLEVSFGNLAAGESKEVIVRAKIDALKAFEFSALLGNIEPLANTVNTDIPEYLNILLEGKFFLSPDLNKEAGSQLVTFNQLNIQNTAEVTSDSFELNAFDNTTTSRLDITTIALDGTLNNGSNVTIRSIERLGVIGSKTAYVINPDPILVNGQKLLQFGVTNPFTGFGLGVGGTATFAISEVTGTAGADGIFGNGDDNVAGRQLLQTLAIADGSGADLDADAAEVSTEFLIAKSLTDPTNKVFAITTSVNDPVFGAQQFTNYFDINGQAIPANIVDTTGNSLFINVALNTFTVTNGDTGFPTYNNSDFLLSGDLNEDGILDQFGASLSEFIWNKIEDQAYLADLAIWETLASEANGDFADEQAIVDFLYDKFISTDVFGFENFQQGSFTLENEVGDRTRLEILHGELRQDDGVLRNTPNSLELLVNDDGVFAGEAVYGNLEKALSDLFPVNSEPAPRFRCLDITTG
ncbi:MAG: hypothetical protein HC799_07510 [Limnothrix sp. RL_2_0]|nr:hypothetical protein [Limnothrix sp. RL_2_0]